MRPFITLTLALLTLAVVSAFATPAMADGPLPWKGSGSGDWNGQRAHVDEDFGLTFWWLQDIHASQNVKGGISKGGAVEFRTVLEVNYQFEPLTPLKGSEIQVSAAWNVGGNVGDNVGAFLQPSTAYRDPAIRLYELYWGQFFADKQVHFKIGRIGLAPAEYGYSALLFSFMSPGYNANPGAFYLNQPVMSFAYPVATWGAQIKVAPKKQDFQFFLGVYNGWPRNLADGDKRGVDFTMNLFKSTFVVGEFWYKLNQDPEDQGLPGNYKIGGMYDSGPFSRLDNSSETERRNPGWYVIGDQMLFRERPAATPTDPAKLKGGFKMSHPTDQGLYLWGNFVMNPKQSINIAPYWVSAGLQYKGPIPHRDDDQINFGFYYASLSPDSILDFEFQFEFFYTFQFTSWLSVAPDMQYFRKPGGGSVKDALVMSINIHFNL
jgi:porin